MGSPAASARRRGRNEGSIYKDEARDRWYAAVSLGYGPDGKTWRRHKISGRTRADVAEKLKELQAEQDSGVQPSRAYTVQRAVNDWLTEGLDGRSAQTVTLNRHILKPVTAVIGSIELRKLTAHDVRRALTQLAQDNSSRTVVIAHNALTRALRHAEANRHVMHNVAALVDTPKGQSGRPSRTGLLPSKPQLPLRGVAETVEVRLIPCGVSAGPSHGSAGPMKHMQLRPMRPVHISAMRSLFSRSSATSRARHLHISTSTGFTMKGILTASMLIRRWSLPAAAVMDTRKRVR